MVWTSVGEGGVALVVGKMMEWFSYNWLLYSVLVIDIMLVLLISTNANILLKTKGSDKL